MLVSVEQIVACFVFNVRPLVDVFGMVGNILCIAICLSPRLRRAPTTLHLTALAVYDLLFFLGEIPATFDGSGAASAAVVRFLTTFDICRTFTSTILYEIEEKINRVVG